MLKMIQSVKFKQVNNPFLNRLDIATKLGIDDRVDTTTDKDALITLKTNTSSLSFSFYNINIDIRYYINHIF